jgi:DNA mismatch repair protein MutS
MMDQYRRAKSLHKDAVLFFRLGDFYEMFFEDAIEVSGLLNLTLTHRQGEPMCGVPYHAARSYVARLLKLGKKVAICEQLSEPGKGKGLVERDVVEVITPGTALEEDFLDQSSNNYLVALCAGEGASGALPGTLSLAYLDISTAEFRAFSFSAGDAGAVEERLRKELYRLSPRELIVQQSLLERPEISGCLEERPSLILNRLPDWSFDYSGAAEELKARFGLATLKGLGFGDRTPELAAACALLRYVDEAAAARAVHLGPPLPYEAEGFAQVDESSQKNLEIVQNLHDSSRAYSLLETLDYTKTAAGARLLRQWLLEPLKRKEAIEARLDSVEFLYRDQRLLGSLREALSRVLDAERLASRVAMDKAHAKDLLALRDSLEACASVRALLKAAVAAAPAKGAATTAKGAATTAKGAAANIGGAGLLAEGPGGAEEAAAAEAARAIGKAIKEEPSILLTEGNIIRPGYNEELDRLHGLKENSRAVLESYLEEEKEASGISNLRVRYNKIIGYYLEVSKGRLESVPAHFIRRQSLVNGERYTTARLSELESEMNGATERIVELERRLFVELREEVKKAVPAILEVARAGAVQDCLQSFAWAATVRGYFRPSLYEDGRLRIVEGRHPVVEAHLPSGFFVPNGLELSAGVRAEGGSAEANSAGASFAGASFALITGPNMAGKSTFLRQTALIVLMAQVGSFVPALEADIGLVDRIFCRVGAQDNLARGESTFLVEMHETARILNTATERSLVVMDEVGRGTSTIDGLAIAWAVSEDLLSRLGCRTLFATHYHELTALAHPRLKNLSLSVLEEEGEVVFLKRIVDGPALGSYGIHVARLAGLPPGVLARAQSVEDELSRKEKLLPLPEIGAAAPEGGGQGRAGKGGPEKPKAEGLFSPGDMVLSELASLNIDRLSPLEALNRLAALKKELQSG